jgi:hypothetical protein
LTVFFVKEKRCFKKDSTVVLEALVIPTWIFNPNSLIDFLKMVSISRARYSFSNSAGKRKIQVPNVGLICDCLKSFLVGSNDLNRIRDSPLVFPGSKVILVLLDFPHQLLVVLLLGKGRQEGYRRRPRGDLLLASQGSGELDGVVGGLEGFVLEPSFQKGSSLNPHQRTRTSSCLTFASGLQALEGLAGFQEELALRRDRGRLGRLKWMTGQFRWLWKIPSH